MKMVTRIAVISALATFMFAGVNLTWGNAYSDTNGSLGVGDQFGVWFDVNDATSIGWENGMKVGLAGPAGSTFRLGYGTAPTLGMSYTWWEGAGTGWATNLSTALDYTMVGGDFDVTVNLEDDYTTFPELIDYISSNPSRPIAILHSNPRSG